jgi:hypothetical protein
MERWNEDLNKKKRFTTENWNETVWTDGRICTYVFILSNKMNGNYKERFFLKQSY